MNKDQAHYLYVWKRAFGAFVGWTPEETATWAEPLINQMEHPNLVINRSPMFYIARELVSGRRYYDRLSQRDRDRLIETIEIVMKGGGIGWDFPDGYDFDLAKCEIDGLLDSIEN